MLKGETQGCVYEGMEFCLDCLPHGVDKNEITLIESDQTWWEQPYCIACGYEFDYVEVRMIP